jgi:hypothetical protein
MVNLIRELNDGLARLVELSNGERIIISWEEEDEDRVDFRFYEDNTTDGESACKLEKQISGEFTFKDLNADEDYPKAQTGYKLIYMFSPSKYKRMGIGEYIVRWFLDSNSNCSHIYASDPFDSMVRDGSEVTGVGGNFLSKMQDLNLIQNPYKED